MTEAFLCECVRPYIPDIEGCIFDAQGPTPSLAVTVDNDLIITFDEPLSTELIAAAIDSIVLSGSRDDGYKYSWEIVETT